MSDKFSYKVPGASDENSEAPLSDKEPIDTLIEKTIENMVAAPKKDIEEELKNKGFSEEVSTQDSDEFARSLKAQNYTRFQFLSGGVFYNGEQLFVRRFKGHDIKKMALAAEKDSVSYLLDVMADTTKGMDVRDLTSGDFKHLLYWHRLRSFTKRPWVRKWTSRYGNQNEEITEEMGKVLFKTHSMTEKDYKKYTDLGLAVPTMRVIEHLEKLGVDLSITDTYINTLAMYFKGNTWEEKINTFLEADADLIEASRELEELSEHGVEEVLTLKDKNFDPKAYITKLRDGASNLELLIPEYVRVGFEQQALEIRSNIEFMRFEADRIEKEIADGKEVQPEEEKIMLPMTAASFLSGI